MPTPFPSTLLNVKANRYRVSVSGSTYDSLGQKIPNFTEVPVQVLECRVMEMAERDYMQAEGMEYKRQFRIQTPYTQIIDSPYNQSVAIAGIDGALQPVLTDVANGDRLTFPCGEYPEMRVSAAKDEGGAHVYFEIHAYSLTPTGD